jgi:hypothetical protein
MRKTFILRRILNFLAAWDQKQKNREIELLLASSGHRFSDQIERRILEGEMAAQALQPARHPWPLA